MNFLFLLKPVFLLIVGFSIAGASFADVPDPESQIDLSIELVLDPPVDCSGGFEQCMADSHEEKSNCDFDCAAGDQACFNACSQAHVQSQAVCTNAFDTCASVPMNLCSVQCVVEENIPPVVKLHYFNLDDQVACGSCGSNQFCEVETDQFNFNPAVVQGYMECTNSFTFPILIAPPVIGP